MSTPVLHIRIQEKLGTPKCKTIRALLDSGTSSTILDLRHAKKLRVKRASTTSWATAAGTFETSQRAKVCMQLPQLSESLTIDTDVHLAKSISPRYDMIIGRDLMRELGIKMDFEYDMIEYQNLSIPMTDINELDALNDLQFITGIKEPKSTAEAVERVSKILDAKYAPVL
ncbi:unnamed protein product [Cylindrotheca closterium]|uniref:Peptidase A2 domain-containing protein n=1 Tax=Cylindrotheca closterium TaxID=2856 RepID=A0AAD2FLE7_9STRA|nr:unnamed protein product [Cylindrotheca closterium]